MSHHFTAHYTQLVYTDSRCKGMRQANLHGFILEPPGIKIYIQIN